MTIDEKKKRFLAEYEAYWKFPARDEPEEAEQWLKLIQDIPDDRIALLVLRVKQNHDGRSGPRRAAFREQLERLKREAVTRMLADRAPADACGLCGDSGWMYFLGRHEDGKVVPCTNPERGRLGTWVVPCICTTGRTLTDKALDQETSNLQTAAMAQRRGEVEKIRQNYPAPSDAPSQVLFERGYERLGQTQVWDKFRGHPWTAQEIVIESAVKGAAWGPREPEKLARWLMAKTGQIPAQLKAMMSQYATAEAEEIQEAGGFEWIKDADLRAAFIKERPLQHDGDTPPAGSISTEEVPF